MEKVCISVNEFAELIRKATVYDIKRAELKAACYVSEMDRFLFSITQEDETAKDDDF